MEKKHFVKIMTIFVTVLLKMTLCLRICFVFTKKNIILSLFKIDTLTSPRIFSLFWYALSKHVSLDTYLTFSSP